jgi:hypothetical protein
MPILFTQEVWSTGQAAESIAGVDGSPSKDGPQTHECCHDRRVIDLPGVERLQRDFNQYPRAVRVFAVLSPTCPDCLVGYELVSHMAPTTVRLLLWTAMRDGDSASVVSTLIGDDRDCNHYWEDDGWPVSTRLRPLLGLGPFDPEMSAWDVYLLYPPGVIWTNEDPPMPSDWTHNLRDHNAEQPGITAALLARWSSTAI